MNSNLKNFLQKLKTYGEKTNVPNITEANAQFLHFLVRQKKPTSLLEIGTANGYSTIWFADALKPFNGTITTLERSSPTYQEAIKNFDRAGFSEDIYPLYGDAKIILKHWKEDIQTIDSPTQLPKGPQYLESNGLLYKKSIQHIPDTFDIIFLDAQKNQYHVFWELIQPRIHARTLIIVDDIGKFSEKTDDFLNTIEHSKDFDHVILPIDGDDGIMLLQKKP